MAFIIHHWQSINNSKYSLRLLPIANFSILLFTDSEKKEFWFEPVSVVLKYHLEMKLKMGTCWKCKTLNAHCAANLIMLFAGGKVSRYGARIVLSTSNWLWRFQCVKSFCSTKWFHCLQMMKTFLLVKLHKNREQRWKNEQIIPKLSLICAIMELTLNALRS